MLESMSSFQGRREKWRCCGLFARCGVGVVVWRHHQSVLQFGAGRRLWQWRRRLVERASGVQLQRLRWRHGAAAADTGVALLDQFEHLAEIVLNGGHRGDDRRRAEAVRDEGEVGQGSLNGRVEDRRGTSVAEWRPILIQQINQLLHYLPAVQSHTNTDLLSIAVYSYLYSILTFVRT